MKCRILFSGKNKKNVTTLPSAELAKRVVKVKLLIHNQLESKHTSYGGLGYLA